MTCAWGTDYLSKRDKALIQSALEPRLAEQLLRFGSSELLHPKDVANLLAAARAEGELIAKSASNPAREQFAENAKCSGPAVKDSLTADQSVSPAYQLPEESHG